MFTRLRKHFFRGMVRPIVYQTFTRSVIALTICLAYDRVVNLWQNQPSRLGWALIVAGVFYAVMAWMAYLRLDGIHTPTFDRKLFLRKKGPVIMSYGDMIDHVDDEIIPFDELEPDEKDICLLLSNLICAAIFLIASVVFW